MIGAALGPYRVLDKLGEGGMGEVYRARDTTLDRDVALKVLPETVASDPDRLMRFEREAKALAALNHPNIAQVYGIEKRASLDEAREAVSGSRTAIVMELVEGDDLSTVIARGAVPLEEALGIARQIASALEAAHEAGIIHRDLKPANIKVRDDGTVKVLDFGLAKAIEGDGSGSRLQDPSPSLMNSPTMTSPAMPFGRGSGHPEQSRGVTAMGMILGTAAYMAPEQAKGKPVDRRADIWAFGAVLYEMVTGRRLFEAEDVSETLAAVLTRDVSISAMPSNLPAGLRSLLADCLVRDPRQRLRDMGDARLALDKIDQAPAPDADGSTRPFAARALWPAVAAAATLVAVAMTTLYVTRDGPETRDIAFTLTPNLPIGAGREAVSPDGRYLAYATRANGDEPRRYWIRPIGSLDARPVADSENFLQSGRGIPVSPVWSPDSTSLALVFGSELRTVNVVTGRTRTLIDYGDDGGPVRPGGWNESGDVLYGRPDGVWQISDTGGTPRQVTGISGDQIRHVPFGFLPGGRRFLYQIASPSGADLFVGSLDAAPDAQSTSALVASDGRAAYADGYLFFVGGEDLMVQRFDASRGALEGDAVQLLSGVASQSVSVSDTGVLVYRPVSADIGAPAELVHVDRAGDVLNTIGLAGNYEGVSMFDDGRRLVVTRTDSGEPAHVYVVDVARGSMTRLTPGAVEDLAGVPSSDNMIAYTLARHDVVGDDIFMRAANGAGSPSLLVNSSYNAHPNGWSPDGRFLLYDIHVPGRAQDLMIVGRDSGDPVALLETDADENYGTFSPDGRWIAYRSNESNDRYEIYVRDFVAGPTPAFGLRKEPISVNGGHAPRWSHDGARIYYLEGATLMQVSVSTEATGSIEVGLPVRLFDMHLKTHLPYDVLPDGTFIMNRLIEPDQAQSTPMHVIVNWTTLLPG